MGHSVFLCILSTIAILSGCTGGRLEYSYYGDKKLSNAAQIDTFDSQTKLYNVHPIRQILNKNYGEPNIEEDDRVTKNAGGIKNEEDVTIQKGENDDKEKIQNEGIQIENEKEIYNGKHGAVVDRTGLSDFLRRQASYKGIGDGHHPEVVTAEGALRGQRITYPDVSYDSFVGIPYVEKPIRFQAAVPHPGWNGTRDAIIHPDMCTQKIPLQKVVIGNEDCLYLNVATPSIEATGLPVLVAIHGGAFKYQTGNAYIYNPEMLMVKRNMIVVSFNYRLGAFGFISTRTADAPGNVGMKDIIQALRWIQRNIHKFGGDPNKVTLYGVSSGAAAIEFLILSQMAINLFSSIVIQSGSALNYMNFQSKPLHNAIKLGKLLGIETTDSKKLIEYLKHADAKEIMSIADVMDTQEYPVIGLNTFVPSTEDPLPGEEIFLEDHPYSIMKSGDYIKVPSMMGFNDLEGAEFTSYIYKDPEYLNTLDPVIEYLLPTDLMESIHSRCEKNEILRYVRDIYFNGQWISNETIKGFVDLMGDQLFVNGMFRSIDIRLRNSDAPIYYWEFGFQGIANNLYEGLGLKGVKHAADVSYFFKVPFIQINYLDRATAQTIEKLITMVSNFMIYGNPTPNVTSLLPVTWYPIQSKETLDYLAFNGEMQMKQDPYRERRLLWEYLYSRIYGLIE